ncbi:hypothetical protein K2173_024967 [Erythroxylum novogranatense]|uniref:C2 domain-containing protein n=1 Tax=Erythroxylum novogranatense TaxID=1862640 RepID=A0AAV8UG87_9ROSI|nr:hypothetical protein K2173_024967 [Erythroxylum novogranatense]
MAFFTLEIVIFSAEKLSLDKKPVKRNTFVVVKTDPFNGKSTKADFEGGSSPSWNEKLVMVMPMHARFITLQVLCRVGPVDRVIGTVDVPASDFLGKYRSAPESYEHILSYRLKNEKGEKNGIVNLSIKVSDHGSPAPVTRNNKSKPCASSSKPAMGVPVGAGRRDGGVVMGIPVCGGAHG